MEKLLLIDGNSMVFRAFYATLNHRMTSKTGQPTNAVFGFSNMLSKALELINPDYTLIAFDTAAKTHRHNAYQDYKAQRKPLPEELISQFPLVREFLDHVPLRRFELEGFEADDIIGTMVHKHPEKEVVILTSDRDMLQLINANTTVLLMKKGITEMELVDEKALLDNYELTPSQVIELKGLMGDSADNIPGIKGVGEKTAMKLLKEYETIENLYQHTDELKGKLKEKIVEGEDIAYLSKRLATIDIKVEFDIDLDECEFNLDEDLLAKFYRKYDMTSLLKKVERKSDHAADTLHLSAFTKDFLKDDLVIAPYVLSGNGHDVQVDGYVIGDNKTVCYIDFEEAKSNFNFKQYIEGNFSKRLIDGKNTYHSLYQLGMVPQAVSDDLLVLAYLVDSSITSLDKMKDAYNLWDDSSGAPRDQLVHLLQNSYPLFISLREQLELYELSDLYEDVEVPLVAVLSEMESTGILADKDALVAMASESGEIVDRLTQKIYTLAGKEFNINSTKQLGEVLFDELGLPTGKKRSTAVGVLEGLQGKHEIVDEILVYRKYQKFLSTYAEGLQKFIGEDHRIHTVFSQTTAQTGRLSSTDPNLQNISVRDEDTRKVRKVFVADEGYTFFSADYSQIELRVLAHMANEPGMISAFNDNHDIHTETAMKVFGLERDQVTSLHRRQAKAVNFGIIYGISDYGLANQLGISPKEAGIFIANYFESFSHIEAYMKDIVAECEKNQYVTTMFNRRRYLPEINDRNFARKEAAKRAAMNAPIQGSAADLIKMAMVKVRDQLLKQKLHSKLILQVHDELLLLVHEDEKEIVSSIVTNVMTNIYPMKVKLEVTSSFGKTWYEVK